MLYKNREMFSKINKKLGGFFSRFGLSPNTWTLLVFLPTIATLYFLSQGNFIYAAFFFAVAALVDIIDGSVARATGRVTKKGAYLDTVVDRYMEGLIVFGLFFVNAPQVYLPFQLWLFLYFFGGMMTTYSKAAAKEKGAVEKEFGGGILERPERMILLFIAVLLASFSRAYLVYMIILLAILSNITAFQRIRIAMKSSKD